MGRLRVDIRNGRFVKEAHVDWRSYGDIVADDSFKASFDDWTAEILPDKGGIIRVRNSEDKAKNRTFKLQNGSLFFDTYAYLRKANYMEFRDRFGIMGVVREDPNQLFMSVCQEFVPVTSDVRVASNGNVEHFGRDGYNRDTYRVDGATWAICWKHYAIPLLGGHFEECFEGYLYTLEEDPMQLAPDMEEVGVLAPWWTGTALIG